MKKFREHLEKKTQMLQGNIKSQQDALEMVKEQLQRMQSSGFQVRGQFHISEGPKVEEKGGLDSFQAVSYQALLTLTAAAPGQHRMFARIFCRDIQLCSLSLGCRD